MHINPREEDKKVSTPIVAHTNNTNSADPATIFDIEASYVLYTEQREFAGIYVGRYMDESGTWIIQLRDAMTGSITEVVANKLTGWKKITSTSEL